MKHIIEQSEKALSLAKELRKRYNFPDHNASSLKLLDLLGYDLENTQIYRGILLEFMAIYYNNEDVKRRFKLTPYRHQILDKLLELYHFFSELDEDNLQAFLDILKLETAMGLSKNSVANLEVRYGLQKPNSSDDLFAF